MVTRFLASEDIMSHSYKTFLISNSGV